MEEQTAPTNRQKHGDRHCESLRRSWAYLPIRLVCQYLLWGLLPHNRASFCSLSSMIQKPQWERSVRHPTVLRSSRVLLLACCHFT